MCFRAVSICWANSSSLLSIICITFSTFSLLERQPMARRRESSRPQPRITEANKLHDNQMGRDECAARKDTRRIQTERRKNQFQATKHLGRCIERWISWTLFPYKRPLALSALATMKAFWGGLFRMLKTLAKNNKGMESINK